MQHIQIFLLMLSFHRIHPEEIQCESKDRVSVDSTVGFGERTFVMIKPDGVQRGLVGEVVTRLEKKGLQLEGMKVLWPERELVETHYKEHLGRSFYPGLVDYVTSGPVVAMVWRGRDSVKAVRKLLGATNPLEAESGTIRGDLAMDKARNLCHASDSNEAAVREIELWFQKKELVVWRQGRSDWLYGKE